MFLQLKGMHLYFLRVRELRAMLLGIYVKTFLHRGEALIR